MRRSCLGIVGILLAGALTGCSDTGVQNGTVPFKGTNTEQFNSMKNQTIKHMQDQDFAKKPAADDKAEASKPPTATESKPAEPKPAAVSKPAEPKPAGDAKSGAEPKPASKSG